MMMHGHLVIMRIVSVVQMIYPDIGKVIMVNIMSGTLAVAQVGRIQLQSQRVCTRNLDTSEDKKRMTAKAVILFLSCDHKHTGVFPFGVS